MADKMTGVVTAKARTGKSIQLEDGNWYGAFNASQIPEDVQKGDSVEFDYKVNGRYRNINGNVRKVSGGSSAPASSTGGAARSTGGRSYRANGEEGGFPIHPLAYERALDRRNAVQAASNLIAAEIAHGTEFTDPIEDVVLQLAARFEAYSTGDDERMAMAEMTSSSAE